jgi:hypothetical protein
MGHIEDRRDIPAADGARRGDFVFLPALTEAKLALYQAMRACRVGKAETRTPAELASAPNRPAAGICGKQPSGRWANACRSDNHEIA